MTERPDLDTMTDTQTDPDPQTVLDALVDGLTLPDGIHAEALTVTTAATHTPKAVIALWGPAEQACPRCGQADRPADWSCPVMLDPAMGEVQGWDQQHDCGAWWGPMWETVPVPVDLVDPDDDTYGDAVARGAAAVLTDAVWEQGVLLAEQVRSRDAGLAAKVLSRLLTDLDDAMGRLATGDEPEDVTTGSELEPGVWYNGGTWEAWDYGPGSDGTDVLVVTADDLDPQ